MKEYRLEDISVGMTESFEKAITIEMEDSFRRICGDENPLHREDDFAKTISGERFERHVSFGMLTASLYSTFAGMYMPGKYSLIHSFEELSFMKPVYAGDTLTVEGTVVDKDEDLKMIRVKVKMKNQAGTTVSRAKMKILVLK